MNTPLLLNANSLHIPLASQSVQMVATSPPYYSLRDYGVDGQIGQEETPAAYVENLVRVFREVWRVLKADGVLWLNLGDSYNGSGGAGGDYAPGGLKDGQPKYKGARVDGLKPFFHLFDSLRILKLFSVRNQPDSRKPFIQSKRAILKDCADFDGVLFPASFTFPDSARADVAVSGRLAMGTSYAIRPAERFHKLSGDVEISEIKYGLLEGLGEISHLLRFREFRTIGARRLFPYHRLPLYRKWGKDKKTRFHQLRGTSCPCPQVGISLREIRERSSLVEHRANERFFQRPLWRRGAPRRPYRTSTHPLGRTGKDSGDSSEDEPPIQRLCNSQVN